MEFTPVTDLDRVVEFLTGEEWPFHVVPRPTEAAVRAMSFTDAFWIGDVGLLRLFDLADGTPMFDLRVRSAARGRGVGTAAVRWLTGHVFGNYPADRIEGTTRQDNHAMRRIFEKSGWAKESHYRAAWPGADRVHDSVGYAVLRRDWETGTVTPVDWTA